MLLEKLTVSSKGGIIRDIPFNLQGLNLVVDATPDSGDVTKSGNNVGKTTFIRAIDFCFGSSGRDLYQDKEDKKDRDEVKSFLFDNEVSFTLTLLKPDSHKLVLKRSFNKDEDLFIDGIRYKNQSDYCFKLNELLFHIKPTERKVSFRNIIKKFVRSDDTSSGNMYKILYGNTPDSVYEALYLKLFGFPDEDVLTERLSALTRLQKLETELKKIRGKSSLPKYKSKLVQLQQVIEEKEGQIKNFNLPATYDLLFNKLKDVKNQTSYLSSLVGSLNTKISLSNKTREELLHNKSKVDPEVVRQLYDEAKLLLPKVQKEFEEVLEFHQKMVINKIKFVEHHINKLEAEKIEVKSNLDNLLNEQSRLLQLLDNTGTFDDLIKIREEINSLYTEKGKIVAQIDNIESIENRIRETTSTLNDLNFKFNTYQEGLNKNIQEVFNKYFKTYTSLTHDEQLYIYYDNEKRKFEFDHIKGNEGDGYKKADIIAFDLAFISFFNELGLDFPRFVIHDKLEVIHKNQIQTIFEIADSIKGQFVVSVLKERIQFLDDEYIKTKSILELSQDDKFFRF